MAQGTLDGLPQSSPLMKFPILPKKSPRGMVGVMRSAAFKKGDVSAVHGPITQDESTDGTTVKRHAAVPRTKIRAGGSRRRAGCRRAHILAAPL